MTTKTVWYCHHYAGAPSLGMSYRPYYLTQAFRRAHHRAYVVSASEHHLQQKTLPQRRAVQHDIIDGVPYIRLKTLRYATNGMGRMLNMLMYAMRLRCHYKAITSITGRPDVIIVSSGHLFHYPVLQRIAKKYGAKLIFEVRDLWPLSLIQLLNLSRFHPLVMWMAAIERRAYRYSDTVVSLLDGAFTYMQQKGLDASKFKVIPNGVCIDSPKAVPAEEPTHDCFSLLKLQALKNENVFILGYTGALGVPNAINYLIEAMRLVQQRNVPVHCLIVGEGGQKDALNALVSQHQLNNVTILPAVPKLQIPLILNGCDALYLGWLNADIYQYGVSPNKLFDYLLSGKPVIESTLSERSLVKKFNCGLQCEPEDAKAIADAIITMYYLPEKTRESMGLQGEKTVKMYYDYRFLAQKYMELF